MLGAPLLVLAGLLLVRGARIALTWLLLLLGLPSGSFKVVRDVPSPDGAFVATHALRHGGVTASMVDHVFLRRRDDPPFADRDDLYAASEFHGELVWRDERHLELVCHDHRGDPWADREEHHGVRFTVRYEMPRPIRVEIPHGFRGPAVVVFGDPAGAPLPRGFTALCRVGASGLLRLSDPPPEAAELGVWEAYPDGNPRRLYEGDDAFDDELQVVRRAVDDRDGTIAVGFLVGRPSETREPETLAAAVEAALRR